RETVSNPKPVPVQDDTTTALACALPAMWPTCGYPSRSITSRASAASGHQRAHGAPSATGSTSSTTRSGAGAASVPAATSTGTDCVIAPCVTTSDVLPGAIAAITPCSSTVATDGST